MISDVDKRGRANTAPTSYLKRLNRDLTDFIPIEPRFLRWQRYYKNGFSSSMQNLLRDTP